MTIQPPRNNNAPAYPTRVRLAAMAGVLLATGGAVYWLVANMRWEPENAWTECGALDELDAKDLSLFIRQQEEGAVLLGPYADHAGAVPEVVVKQLQASVAKYAKLRAQLWSLPPFGSDRFQFRLRTLGVPPTYRDGVSYRKKLNSMFLEEDRMAAYAMLGSYAYTEESMPQEKLQAWMNLLFKQIRNKQGREIFYRLLEEDLRTLEKRMLDEEHAVVARHAGSVESMTPIVLEELQVIVSKHASDYRQILHQYGWPDEQKFADIQASGREPKPEDDAAGGLQQEEKNLYDRQIAEHRLVLDVRLADPSSIPHERLADLQKLILKQIEERKALHAKYATESKLPEVVKPCTSSTNQ